MISRYSQFYCLNFTKNLLIWLLLIKVSTTCLHRLFCNASVLIVLISVLILTFIVQNVFSFVFIDYVHLGLLNRIDIDIFLVDQKL